MQQNLPRFPTGVVISDEVFIEATPHDMFDTKPIKLSDTSTPSTPGVKHIDISYERVS